MTTPSKAIHRNATTHGRHFWRALIRPALCALLLPLPAAAGAPDKPAVRVPGDYTYVRDYVRWRIAKEMRQHDVQGLSIALVDDQRIVWAQGFGYADTAKGVLAGPDTLYHVGSIAKLFTATSAMQLAEQGRLDIDRPVQAYLPGFSMQSRFDKPPQITVRQLMTHHAGLPRDVFKGMWTAQPEPFTRVLDHLKDEYLVYPPDTVFSYSNIGMTLLGHVVQQVAGRDFATHLETTLLQPIGMAHAYFAPASRDGAQDAKGYRNHWPVPTMPLRDLPAGGLHASVNDLSRFMMMQFAQGRVGDRQLIKAETLAEMWRPQNTHVALDVDLHVGLGWMLSGFGDINIRNAGPIAHHSGSTPLFHSQLILLPVHRLGVVVLANSAEARPAVTQIAVDALTLALEAKTGITPPAERPWVDDDAASSVAALRRFPGHYTTLIGAATIERSGSRLRGEVVGRSFNLVPRGAGWYGLQYRLFGLIPISLSALDRYALRRASIAGREVLLAGDGYAKLLVGERLTPHPISPAWRRRVGTYEMVNRDQDELLLKKLALVIKDGVLLLRVTVPHGGESGEIAVEPVSDTQAVLPLVLAGAGETLQAVHVDGVEMWRYSGYLFKRTAD